MENTASKETHVLDLENIEYVFGAHVETVSQKMRFATGLPQREFDMKISFDGVPLRDVLSSALSAIRIARQAALRNMESEESFNMYVDALEGIDRFHVDDAGRKVEVPKTPEQNAKEAAKLVAHMTDEEKLAYMETLRKSLGM